jgi:hypothetical protein
MWVMPNLVSVCLKMVLVLVQDRCMVCAKHRNSFGRTRWFSLVTRLKWNFVSVHLEIVLILTQVRCTVCAERTIGLEIIMDAPIGSLRWRGSCQILFRSFGDDVSFSAGLVHGLRQMYHRFSNHFGHTWWYSEVTTLKWKLILVHLEIVLILMQDRCTVYVECTTGSVIIFDAHDGTPRWHGSCQILFQSVWRRC